MSPFGGAPCRRENRLISGEVGLFSGQVECCIRRNSAQFQLHPLVVPHDSQTKHEPAGRIRTPQVEQ
jgi:hypothetical protein